MNFFDHKDLGNHLPQLCPKVVKHPVFIKVLDEFYYWHCKYLKKINSDACPFLMPSWFHLDWTILFLRDIYILGPGSPG
jgi:hypothetical protein